MHYEIPFDDIASGTVADAFKTILTIIVPDVAGKRCRIKALNIGPADETPADGSYAVQIARIADFSAGAVGTIAGVTTAASGIPKMDTDAPDAPFSAADDYSAEPTTFEALPVYHDGVNHRGGVNKEWFDEKSRPVALRDQVLAIQIAPRAASAYRVSGSVEVEAF